MRVSPFQYSKCKHHQTKLLLQVGRFCWGLLFDFRISHGDSCQLRIPRMLRSGSLREYPESGSKNLLFAVAIPLQSIYNIPNTR